MIGGLLFLAVSLAVVALSGINLRNCISKGTASLYGRVYSRVENSGTFWFSAISSVFALLFGLALALTAIAGLMGLV